MSPRKVPQRSYKAGPMDECQSPPYAILPIVPYLKKEWVIWEPASGFGWMADALESHVVRVIRSEQKLGQDFYTWEPAEPWDVLITNPPYVNMYRWNARAYSFKKPWAQLLKVDNIGTNKCQGLYEQYGIQIIYVDQRINFYMPNKGYSGAGSQFATAWYCYGFNLPEQLNYFHWEGRNVDERTNIPDLVDLARCRYAAFSLDSNSSKGGL